MRVQVLEANSAYLLNEKVNDWLRKNDGSVTVVDIKYSVSTTNWGSGNSFYAVHGALIQYN